MTHYGVEEIKTVADVRQLFPNGTADEDNWLLASTSGTHGTYCDLAAIEQGLSLPAGNEYKPDWLTVLIIHPRVVAIFYGHIMIDNQKDIDFLRGLIQSSLQEIAKTQADNVIPF